MRYAIIIYWNNEDQAFIAEVPELPGCDPVKAFEFLDFYKQGLQGATSAPKPLQGGCCRV